MASTIWKFPLRHDLIQPVEMPEGAVVLTAAMQSGAVTFWALVNPEARLVQRIFTICGTGHPAPNAEAGTYTGTVFDGPFVWHIFEKMGVTA